MFSPTMRLDYRAEYFINDFEDFFEKYEDEKFDLTDNVISPLHKLFKDNDKMLNLKEEFECKSEKKVPCL